MRAWAGSSRLKCRPGTSGIAGHGGIDSIVSQGRAELWGLQAGGPVSCLILRDVGRGRGLAARMLDRRTAAGKRRAGCCWVGMNAACMHAGHAESLSIRKRAMRHKALVKQHFQNCDGFCPRSVA
eukprot:scaffold289347_cov17-Tisochrysis_lutea.AAC.2